MVGGARDEDGDVIAIGRERRRRSPRSGRLAWLLVVALTAALAVSAAVAVHYRAEADGLHLSGPPPASVSVPSLPEVTSVVLRLIAGGGVAATVVITAAALPGAGRAQFTVTAVVTGGAPGTVYDLIGSECSAPDPQPDDVWATGVAGQDGTADLTGYAWTAVEADSYWMVLNPVPVNPAPGLRGQFAEAEATPFPVGQPPCPP